MSATVNERLLPSGQRWLMWGLSRLGVERVLRAYWTLRGVDDPDFKRLAEATE